MYKELNGRWISFFLRADFYHLQTKTRSSFNHYHKEVGARNQPDSGWEEMGSPVVHLHQLLWKSFVFLYPIVSVFACFFIFGWWLIHYLIFFFCVGWIFLIKEAYWHYLACQMLKGNQHTLLRLQTYKEWFRAICYFHTLAIKYKNTCFSVNMYTKVKQCS